MKSARERAEEACVLARLHPNFSGYQPFVDAVEAAFKEHARDQRHLCAEEVRYGLGRYGKSDSTKDIGHDAATNAPAPGEEQ